jgi:flagellar basal-body rod modification protein FlgD
MTTVYDTTRTASAAQQTNTSQSWQSNSILDKDSFLRLLVTQLANQDPTNPMDDREFIAQMAQFSSLEQMNNVANELSGLRQLFSLSSGLIGKTIEWMAADGKLLSGIVDSILLRDGKTIVVVDDAEIPVTDIVRVSETQREPADDPGDGEPEEGGGGQDE